MDAVEIRGRDMAWDIAADLHFPPGFDAKKKYPAIISAHPIGSCKEQTAGNVYGQALAREGFVVIAFDRSFQPAPRWISTASCPISPPSNAFRSAVSPES